MGTTDILLQSNRSWTLWGRESVLITSLQRTF